MDDFAKLIDDMFVDRFDEVEAANVFGIKIVFSNIHSEDLKAFIIPSVASNRAQAEKRKNSFMANPQLMTMFTAWFNLVHLKEDVLVWQPIAARVIELAPIPF